ncbi:unnamed protein product, partial [marine sediment metagenome]
HIQLRFLRGLDLPLSYGHHLNRGHLDDLSIGAETVLSSGLFPNWS